MPVSLVSNDLLNRFKELLESTDGELNIISPFIGTQTATLLADWLKENPKIECNIITRFYREDFIERVSSIYGLESLLQAKAKIYALVDLHSKLYLFDSHSTIIGSANFTKGGFVSNHEICVLMDDEPEIAEKAHEYFYDLLEQIQAAGDEGIVTQEWIDEEKKHVPQLAANQKNKTVTYSNDKKKGAVLKKIVQPDLFEQVLENTDEPDSTERNWLKFEGTGEARIASSLNYPEMKGIRKRDLNETFFPRRPSGILMDDTLFLTIVSYDEQERPTPMIVGYAKTSGYNKDNIATDTDIKEAAFKHRFPFFVEFTSGKVIKAPIKNGIRLVDLYNSVGKATFPSLRKRKSVTQKTLQSMHFRRSHIRITQEATNFLMEELNRRFSDYGEINL
ncbi:phospholipase D family protein [Bacillaceae bacterium IKA-2]|nr:phospholipase D family protein [Bacillaceae bacterium IKA-2]